MSQFRFKIMSLAFLEIKEKKDYYSEKKVFGVDSFELYTAMDLQTDYIAWWKQKTEKLGLLRGRDYLWCKGFNRYLDRTYHLSLNSAELICASSKGPAGIRLIRQIQRAREAKIKDAIKEAYVAVGKLECN